METKDYYQILGVSREADDKEIKSAYRKLARENHPDVHNGDKEAERRFQEINEAYEVLSDADNRRKYDQLGAGEKEVHYDFSDLFGGDQESYFHDLFGAAGRRARARPSQMQAHIEISLAEAFSGTTRHLEILTPQLCPKCQGAGCAECGGIGQVHQARRLEIRIPPGAVEGSQVKAGDVTITISLLPNPDYEVKGRDLIRKLPVGLYQAVRGGEVKFRTLAGKEIALKIPAESQNGRSFRLKGQGLPGVGQEPAGDLYLRLEVVLPTGLSERERQLFDELASLR
ncbi:MAG: J domain-containing protein [Candidatus Eremiobacteraeota bacterium]|nr:J domain-containing protein [Candidatus Eremiobacteraeota bacterium]MCW5872005.1 J domain-containing protein [Candidatus Eremiobacteraeota bacterium]